MSRRYRLMHASMLILLAFFVITLAIVSSNSVHAAPALSGPSAGTWYFAEGRVGAGFRQWLTISNPGSSSCQIKTDYYYTLDGDSTARSKSVTYSVNAGTRYTDYVNSDLNIAQDATTGATLSAVVAVDAGSTPTCAGVVVERPMYFTSFHSVSSGTDVLGVTTLGTKYYLADIPSGSAGESFLSVLNPGTLSANVTVTYYSAGAAVKSETINVGAKARGTFQPNDSILPAHTAAIITSDRPIAVERPSYFTSEYGVAGSADVTGAPALNDDWLFADGLTSSGTQENLSIANLSGSDTNVIVTLKSLSGATQDYTLTVAANSQNIFNVNSHNSFSGSTPEVAAEVKSDGKNIVAQREMFTTYSGAFSATGITDTLGAPPAKAFNFAEGFTSAGFDEQLALVNPTGSAITVSVTLNNMLGRSVTKTFSVGAQSRYMVSITDLVANNLALSSDNTRAYAVSMQVTSDSAFLAERTMHWSAFGTQGAESVVGYTGG